MENVCNCKCCLTQQEKEIVVEILSNTQCVVKMAPQIITIIQKLLSTKEQEREAE